MSSANAEQKIAIAHNGGVQLQAGAGSGKTFVLIEHIIYLIEKKLYLPNGELFTNDEHQLRIELKSYLAKIVLMTFTKKAAGELKTRLNSKIKQKIKDYNGGKLNPWSYVQVAITSMTVTTIDGFCYKLLSLGYFPHISSEIEIIQTAAFEAKMNTLVDWWLSEKLDKLDPVLQELMLSQIGQVKSALRDIFSDPDLRIMWKDLAPQQLEELDFKTTYLEIIRFKGLNSFYEMDSGSSEVDDAGMKSAWWKFLNENANKLQMIPKNQEDLQNILNIFPARLPPKPKDEYVQARLFWEAMVEFRDNMVKKYFEDFIHYFQDRDSTLNRWLVAMKSLFDFIDLNYHTIAGTTFADLEYDVLQGLRIERIREKVYRDFHYLIVDEFQDTSVVQFEIIKAIIQEDYTRLFTVGDMKQAIYGFKGGEIKVFKQCQEKTPLNLNLANNYRSHPSIIEFNNELFDHLFKVGPQFTGLDIDPVEVVFQAVPSEKSFEYPGSISKTIVKLTHQEEGKYSLSSQKINQIEAEMLFAKVKSILANENSSNIAILYRNLKPSVELINLFIQHEISFTAQIKIPNREDPILALFQLLIEWKFDKNHNDTFEFQSFVTKSILGLIGVTTEVELSHVFQQFYANSNLFGSMIAFEMFLSQLNIANSNWSNNIQKIKSLIQVADSDEDLYLLLNNSADEKYSIDFQSGANAHQVTIMTAHASKGLQFGHILLGGIHTNGREMPDSSIFGKMPGSLKWKKLSTDREFYQTPIMVMEKAFNDHKDFAESKRLFYVACTRAEEAIHWVDFDYDPDLFSTRLNKQSWIFGLRHFEEHQLFLNQSLFDQIKQATEVIAYNLENFTDEKSSWQMPLFHTDPLGVCNKGHTSMSENANWLVLPELSVTRLALITQCPRKFYLANHLKLQMDQLAWLLEGDLTSPLEFKLQEIQIEKNEEFMQQTTESASERGSRIHATIHEIIQNGLVLPLALINSNEAKYYSWVMEELKKYQNWEFISERALKFEIFHYMISGTPDLIIKSGQQVEIWDFKTGKPNQEKERPYWFQLMAYAKAAEQIYQLQASCKIILKLVYLDTQEIRTLELNLIEITSRLAVEWDKLSDLNQIEPTHCSSCPYDTLCNFNAMTCTSS
jgi:ATP-dependent exoDNAse (exonuclease V) beta subunit